MSETIADLGTWQGGLTPSKAVPANWGGNILWVTPKDMGVSNITTSQDKITQQALANTTLSVYKPGSVVVVFRSGILRHSFPVAIANVSFTVNQDLKVLEPREGVHSRFAYHLLVAIGPQLIQKAVKTGTTVESVDFATFLSTQVYLPCLDEQRRIAGVLDALDETIAASEVLIAKLKAMRQGLLHDLLTRGLDENGELRDPERHPELFRESEVGRVPRVWEVEHLGTFIQRGDGVIQTGPFGSQLHAHEYVKEGIPVIMPQDMINGSVNEALIARISESRAVSLGRHRVQLGDVVFARRGDLERCSAISNHEVGWLCGTGCLLVRPPKTEMVGDWLARVYEHPRSQRQILARAVGSTMVNLNTNLLAHLTIAKPSIAEQLDIITVISAHDTRLRAEEEQLGKLRRLKAGLMDDLLSGRVRVPEHISS